MDMLPDCTSTFDPAASGVIPSQTMPAHPMDTAPDFIKAFCLPLLRSAQNADGGWGFHAGAESRVEATCWALQALTCSAGPDAQEAIASGLRYLRAAQLPDGSWPSTAPSTAGESTGCWVTSLACWVLLRDKSSSHAVAAGLKWLCDDWPRDSTPWARMLRRLFSAHDVAPQNDALRGWGWTPRTASWVEPTSFALLVLAQAPPELLPAAAKRRRPLAVALLYDRMCPGGGWNCGNPMVYGVAGEPLVIPTAWALLALRDDPGRPERDMSLAWLEQKVVSTHGPVSLALAKICLESYGRSWPADAPDLHSLYPKNEFLQSVPVIAWVCLAAATPEKWFTAASARVPGHA